MPNVCRDRAEELVRQGHEVHVITTSGCTNAGGLEPYSVLVEEGVHVHYTATRSQQWTREFAKACAAECKQLAPDIVHSESFDRDELWWEDKPAQHFAITMHGFGFGAWLTKWNLYRAYGHALPLYPAADIYAESSALRSPAIDVVFAVSRWEQMMLRDQYGVAKAELLYNPIPNYFFGNVPSRGDFARSYISAAVSQAATRRFSDAQRAAEQAGVRLTVCSTVPRDMMPAAYDNAAALVLPTAFCQGFDLSVAEARARRVPAIMTATGSYLHEAQPWDVLVELGDVDGLARALKERPYGKVPACAAEEHRPAVHAFRWLNAILETGG